MSTGSTLPRALLAGLLDDAAVFPPGNAPLPQAVADHRVRAHQHPWADLVGPLLVPAAAAHALPPLLTAADEPPLPVALVARPGTPLPALAEAVTRLREEPAVALAGVELAHQPGWEEALSWGLPVVVEVDRDPDTRAPALASAAVAGGARTAQGRPPVRVKLRTQSSPAGPVPTADQVAGFLADAHAAGLPAKLTGGLHHAVATTVPVPGEAAPATEPQHGLLNVLLAAERVTAGATPEEVVAVLADRDGGSLGRQAAAVTGDRARAARALLTTVGCCGVLEPLTELADLGLLPRRDARQEEP